VLQEREFERLGSGKTHRVNVRLVAATHRNLGELVARNQFRSDLCYRLNVFPIVLPSLREREEDIAVLVSHFVELFAQRMGKWISNIPKETLDAFTSYSWPGNVRELQNSIERAVIGSDNGGACQPSHNIGPEPPWTASHRREVRRLGFRSGEHLQGIPANLDLAGIACS
jgi:formate hydrogenlyase transcriptional activator